jgi:hypothetical protein
MSAFHPWRTLVTCLHANRRRLALSCFAHLSYRAILAASAWAQANAMRGEGGHNLIDHVG